MPYLLVRHKASDFSKWKAAYDAHLPAREEVGLKEGHLLRNMEDPNEVVLANRYREQKLAHCRELLDMPAPEPPALESAKDYRERYQGTHRPLVVGVPSLSPSSHACD